MPLVRSPSACNLLSLTSDLEVEEVDQSETRQTTQDTTIGVRTR